MKVFVANCSLQIHEFIYRILEDKRERRLTIQPMTGIRLPDEFSQDQIDSLIFQHDKYGFISVGDVKSGKTRKKFTRLCYSIDAPVSGLMIEALTMSNKSALVDFGKDLRRDTAIASNNAVTDVLEQQRHQSGLETTFSSFEQTVQEEEPSTGYNKPTAEIIGEGFKMDPTVATPLRRRRG